jgi:hypothetical protein
LLKRIKRRYLALQLEVSCVPTEREFLDAVWGVVTQLFGEYGASLTSLALINCNFAFRQGSCSSCFGCFGNDKDFAKQRVKIGFLYLSVNV